VASGVPSSGDFNAIWNWNDTSSTPPSASNLGGLTKGEDLTVRISDKGVSNAVTIECFSGQEREILIKVRPGHNVKIVVSE
jgi:hypothetical protein